MPALTADSPRAYEDREYSNVPVVASDIIYQGAAVGAPDGNARPLVGGDEFIGFATARADNSAGASGDIDVRIRRYGGVVLAVPGLAVADVGYPVYATDDGTFSFLPTGGSYIGRVKRYVSAGVGVIGFDVDNAVDPWKGFIVETVSDNKTIDEMDTGKLFVIDADAKIITLPPLTGSTFAIMNGGADGTVEVVISPNANDGIKGPELGAVDNKDLINAKATARRGDYVRFYRGDIANWVIDAIHGIWTKEP